MEEMRKDIIGNFYMIMLDVDKQKITDAMGPFETKIMLSMAFISDLVEVKK